ncbi:putative MFS family arabinose efflux permease [Nocardia tenerifensis]|uniref:Putative MFS family arabinose efflux permease n=1 Tax=Nocardia tenerifensis TaxID=228006 RepID=A0A318KHK7_9NOCA|nr:MFS transporter [Nocardia tenerifensis]PXX71742.1 putative MFS family arabinose efflux permease [Nocardia tenerifensis]
MSSSTAATVGSVSNVSQVAALINGLSELPRKANLLWYLILGGLFLDAYSNAALGAGLVPMTKELSLTPGQVGVLTATAPAVAILFNPVGGWAAARIGRVKPLLVAKLIAALGAVLTATAGSFEAVWFGRGLVGIAYGVDFAVAMALLAEYTPATLRGRLNLWQSVWYVATTVNLALTLAFFKLGISVDIWRWSVGSAGVFAVVLLGLQLTFLAESPTWLAARGRIAEAARSLRRIYGFEVTAGTAAQQSGPEEPKVGFRQAGVLFRAPYLPRTILSTAISLTQSMQYFAVGWYLPVISLAIFGQKFETATLGAMIFNAAGIVGGALSAYLGHRLGLRTSSAIGYAMVTVTLLAMGLSLNKAPIAIAFVLPLLFIFFHSAGPGANGKSIAALSYRSDIRSLGTGVTGMLGSFGSVIGLYVFPQIKEAFGLGPTIALLAVVPLLGLVSCLLIRWDPTRDGFDPDTEHIELRPARDHARSR